MSIAMAYVTVILVWTTTPLGVTWSSETVNPTLAVLARMAIAAALGWFILRAMGRKVCWSKAAIQKYLYADIGIVGAMYVTYQAAGLIPSGLISVIFGLSPMISAVLAQWLLKEDALPLYRWIAFVIALFGLVTIFGVDLFEYSAGHADEIKGIGLLLIAVTLFSLSGVLIKTSKHQNRHFDQAVGSLILSVPIFLIVLGIEQLSALLAGESQTVGNLIVASVETASIKSQLSILYLAVMGSLVGFVCYFYILAALTPSTVALTTLVTPVLALGLGVVINDEAVARDTWIGAGIILFALVLFNWGDRLANLMHVLLPDAVRYKLSRCALNRRSVEDRPAVDAEC